MKQLGNFMFNVLLGLIMINLAIVLFGPNLGPPIYVFTLTGLFFLGIHNRKERLRQWANEQHVPDGDWLVRYSVFTQSGCRSFERRVNGSFAKVASMIGPRSPDEVNKIYEAVADAFEGGPGWVTLYNPPGLTSEQEAQAQSTFVIRFQPFPAKLQPGAHDL